ncbi:hypothetical protein CLF_113065 [Clonorchis sinensis]|uniref:Endonuclease/exonuclease/phosphatase domain-containing protein n=1 Tax=Clonorchis sinensis TaxID=79923 RepID=G7YXJ7_CLOSI|nr:hypothetical protein CLF_113065 [Clonorchis sinensis]
MENLTACPHKMERERSFFRNIHTCLLNPDATCDPATLEKASILIDTIAVEICQRTECWHQVLVFNAPSRIPLEHTKAAILTACAHNPRAIIAVAQPSLIYVTEIWLPVETLDTAVSIPAYNIHRCDRRNSRGGNRAIYSKSEIRATPIDDSGLEGISEAIWISIEQTKRPVLVGCIYLPPTPSPASITELSRIISAAHSLPPSPKFVLGDFNLPDISWSPTSGPTRYASLLAQLSVESRSQTVRRPTRGLHTFDLMFSDEGQLAMAAVGQRFPSSDYCVVSRDAFRSQVTQVGDKQSSPLPIISGIIRGNMLGPIIFLLDINDVFHAVSQVQFDRLDDANSAVSPDVMFWFLIFRSYSFHTVDYLFSSSRKPSRKYEPNAYSA